jgi:hypothetical protein
VLSTGTDFLRTADKISRQIRVRNTTIRRKMGVTQTIFRARPDRPLGPTSLLYRIIPGNKAVEAWYRTPISFQCVSCEWRVTVTPPPLNACIDMPWGHLYLYKHYGMTQYNRALALCSHAGIVIAAGHQVITDSRHRSDNGLFKRCLKHSWGDRNSEVRVQSVSARISPDTVKKFTV